MSSTIPNLTVNFFSEVSSWSNPSKATTLVYIERTALRFHMCILSASIIMKSCNCKTGGMKRSGSRHTWHWICTKLRLWVQKCVATVAAPTIHGLLLWHTWQREWQMWLHQALRRGGWSRDLTVYSEFSSTMAINHLGRQRLKSSKFDSPTLCIKST